MSPGEERGSEEGPGPSENTKKTHTSPSFLRSPKRDALQLSICFFIVCFHFRISHVSSRICIIHSLSHFS
jgi:hypothetical protein